jgi:uncharacterized protein (TIGR03067 family)
MLKELVGRWKVIGCQLHTKWLPSSIFDEFIYVVKDDSTYQIEWADLTYPEYQGGFPKSDTGKLVISEKHMDFIPDKGPFAGKTLKGLFELDHDILKANVAFVDQPRPDAFDAQQGQVYEIWQRLY